MNPQVASAVGGAAQLIRVVLFGGAAVYGLSNSIFNVEGGHRAVVFNRVLGLKETVRSLASHRRRSRRPLTHAPGDPPAWQLTRMPPMRAGVLRRHALHGALVREADHLRCQGEALSDHQHLGEQGSADGEYHADACMQLLIGAAPLCSERLTRDLAISQVNIGLRVLTR